MSRATLYTRMEGRGFVQVRPCHRYGQDGYLVVSCPATGRSTRSFTFDLSDATRRFNKLARAMRGEREESNHAKGR